MIRYSSQAARSLARLLRAYNDIDVYVEDDTLKGVYERIINRALKGNGKVQSVIALGPREVVVSAAQADQDPGGRPRLYIVDGDLDLIAFRRMPAARHLFRLRVYNVENLCCEEGALRAYVRFACPHLSPAAAAAAVDIGRLETEVEPGLRAYFILLAVGRRLRMRSGVLAIDPTSIASMVGAGPIGIDPEKLRQRLREALTEIVKFAGWHRYRLARQAVEQNIEAKQLKAIHFASGKHFWMRYINSRVVLAGGLANNQRTIVSYTADHCSLLMDRRLSRRLRQLTRA